MAAQDIVSFETKPADHVNHCCINRGNPGIEPRNVLRFAPQEHVFLQGDTPRGIYQVIKGTLILYRVMADGRRQIQSFASEGEFLAISFAAHHGVSAEALTEVEVLCTPRAVFDRRLENEPEFRQGILTMIGDKLNHAREQALLLGRKNAMERAATFLLFLDERFRHPDTGYVEIHMSRGDIADYLGLTLETVSRMMNKLKQMGIIDLPQATRFAVCKRSQLITMAGEVECLEDVAA